MESTATEQPDLAATEQSDLAVTAGAAGQMAAAEMTRCGTEQPDVAMDSCVAVAAGPAGPGGPGGERIGEGGRDDSSGEAPEGRSRICAWYRPDENSFMIVRDPASRSHGKMVVLRRWNEDCTWAVSVIPQTETLNTDVVRDDALDIPSYQEVIEHFCVTDRYASLRHMCNKVCPAPCVVKQQDDESVRYRKYFDFIVATDSAVGSMESFMTAVAAERDSLLASRVWVAKKMAFETRMQVGNERSVDSLIGCLMETSLSPVVKHHVIQMVMSGSESARKPGATIASTKLTPEQIAYPQ